MPKGIYSHKRGFKLSEEHKRKIGKSNKGYKKLLGYKHTIESRKRMSNSHKGIKFSKDSINNRINTRRKIGWYKDIEKSREKYKHAKTGVKNGINTRFKKGHKINIGRIVSEKTRKLIGESHNGMKHTEEAKIKIRKARSIQKINYTSSIEIKIQSFLKKLGIEFFTHQYMKIEHGYQCDILIPSMNLVIECDGNYWHKYPIGKEIDHIRTSELIEKGFKVLRLWEIEINEMSIDKFQEKL